VGQLKRGDAVTVLPVKRIDWQNRLVDPKGYNCLASNSPNDFSKLVNELWAK
jgi:hypothetical protein